MKWEILAPVRLGRETGHSLETKIFNFFSREHNDGFLTQ